MGFKPEFPWEGGLVVDWPDLASTSLQFLVGSHHPPSHSVSIIENANSSKLHKFEDVGALCHMIIVEL